VFGDWFIEFENDDKFYTDYVMEEEYYNSSIEDMEHLVRTEKL
jgi:hypothetical protein